MMTGEWERLGAYWWFNVIPAGRAMRSTIQMLEETMSTLQFWTGLPGPISIYEKEQGAA